MPEIQINDKTYILHDGITVLGGGEESDITIEHSKLSRVHARITVKGNDIWIEDLGSKNGTFINSTPLKEKKKISGKDTVKIANLPLKVLQDAVVPAKSETGRTRPIRQAAARSREKSGNKTVFIIIFAAIIILPILGIWVWYENQRIPPEIAAARKILLEAKAAVQIVRVTEDPKLNSSWLYKLKDLESRLHNVPVSMPEEYAAAADYAGKVKGLIIDLEKNTLKSDPDSEAMNTLNKVMESISNGISPKEAAARLRTVITLYPGTKAAALAQEKIHTLSGKSAPDKKPEGTGIQGTDLIKPATPITTGPL